MNEELIMTVRTFWFAVVPAAGVIGFFIGVLFVSVLQRLNEGYVAWFAGYENVCVNCKHSNQAKVEGLCERGRAMNGKGCQEVG